MSNIAFIDGNQITRESFINNVAYYFRSTFLFPSNISLFIACQSALESNFGCSDLVKVSSNYFGMKNPKSRFTLSIGNDFDVFAVYKNFACSALDYYSLLLYNKLSKSNIVSIDSFVSFIKKIKYCPDKDYCDCILKILRNYESSFEKFQG